MSKSATKYLKTNKWFHGTTLDGWKCICEKGILVNHNIGNELDFGHGFYLTPNQGQAEDFTTNLIRITKENGNMQSEMSSLFDLNDNRDNEIAVVIEFEFTPLEWLEKKDEYRHAILNAYDDEFAEFVFYNRVENENGDFQHDFDFIFGVMSDSNPIIDIIRYRNGEIGKTEVIESFKKSTSAKQLSIHSQRLCDTIKPFRAYIIDTGQELNADDYIDKRKHGFTDESAS